MVYMFILLLWACSEGERAFKSSFCVQWYRRMGLEDGVYELDGHVLRVEKGAVYEDNTLMGSATNLKDGVISLSRKLNIRLRTFG